jgi:hypothetical protein
MAKFNLENYNDVASRVLEFVKDFPEGSIQSFIRHIDGPVVVVEARAYRNQQAVIDGAYTSGFAREIEGKSNVNTTSHLENCETSAIGRALANMGYATAANRASRSEMIKVERMNRELDAFVEFIVAEGKNFSDDTTLVINGETVPAKDHIRANWEAITEQYAVARQVVEAVEAATGRKVAVPAAA